MRAFKLLRRKRTGLWSAFSPYKILYAINYWTEAPHGGLFVYESREKAIRDASLSMDSALEVYSCECECELPLPLRHKNGIDWEGKALPYNWPNGTKVFKRVKVEKKIWPKERK